MALHQLNEAASVMKPRLFSIEEACRLLGGCSAWTLRKHAQRKTLRVVRLGSRIFVSIDEIERIKSEGLPCLRTNG
jgi:Helix-turn-helix domain